VSHGLVSAVTVERQGAIAVVQLARPNQLNALTTELTRELALAMTDLHDDPNVRGVVITGEGRAFAAGAELRDVLDRDIAGNLAYNREVIDAFQLVADLPVPTIAAINGFALGGGLELALACTIRIASVEAKLGLPEVRLGILPGAGGTQRLPRLIGRSRALLLLLSGRTISAQVAHDFGIVDQVVPPDRVLSVAIDLASEIARNAPLSVRAIKNAVDVGVEMSLSAATSYTERHLEVLLHSPDSREGIEAFLEKRDPRFGGQAK
jgi:enoyl-CoA hydratase/carnithine racemase